MSKPLRISAEADTELEATSRWYDGKRPGLGSEFLVAVEAVVGLISTNPRLGSRAPGVADDDIRRLLVRRFPHHVVYIELPDRIQVLAVAHDRRRPGYWRSRIPARQS